MIPDAITSAPDRSIGELCLTGDWACVQGDLSTLGNVAERLVEHAREPLHCELVTLSELCRTDPGRAVAAWYRIKDLVLDVQS